MTGTTTVPNQPYNNDLFTVQTRDEQEETNQKQKVKPDQTVNTATRCANEKGWMEWYSVGVQSSVTQKR
jgi:hypothetical protein